MRDLSCSVRASRPQLISPLLPCPPHPLFQPLCHAGPRTHNPRSSLPALLRRLDPGPADSPTSVVDDVLDNSPDVSVLLGKVQGPELGRVLPVVGVGLEDPAGFTLVPDNSLCT